MIRNVLGGWRRVDHLPSALLAVRGRVAALAIPAAAHQTQCPRRGGAAGLGAQVSRGASRSARGLRWLSKTADGSPRRGFDGSADERVRSRTRPSHRARGRVGVDDGVVESREGDGVVGSGPGASSPSPSVGAREVRSTDRNGAADGDEGTAPWQAEGPGSGAGDEESVPQNSGLKYYNVTINVMAQDGNVVGAIEMMERMRNAGVQPDEVTLATVLKALSKSYESYDAQVAFGIYDVLIGEGVVPDRVVFGSLARAVCNANKDGRLDSVLAVVALVEDSGVDMNFVILNHLLRGLAAAKDVAGMLMILERVCEKVTAVPDPPPAAAGADPLLNVNSFNICLVTCAVLEQLDHADATIALMHKVGIEPNPCTVSILVRLKWLSGDYASAASAMSMLVDYDARGWSDPRPEDYSPAATLAYVASSREFPLDDDGAEMVRRLVELFEITGIAAAFEDSGRPLSPWAAHGYTQLRKVMRSLIEAHRQHAKSVGMGLNLVALDHSECHLEAGRALSRFVTSAARTTYEMRSDLNYATAPFAIYRGAPSPGVATTEIRQYVEALLDAGKVPADQVFLVLLRAAVATGDEDAIFFAATSIGEMSPVVRKLCRSATPTIDFEEIYAFRKRNGKI